MYLTLKSISYNPYHGLYTEERYVISNIISDIVELRINPDYRAQTIDDVNQVMEKNFLSSLYYWVFDIQDCRRKWFSLMLYAAAMSQVENTKTKALVDTRIVLENGYFVTFLLISSAGLSAISNLLGAPAQFDVSHAVACMDPFSWAKHLLGWYKDPYFLTRLLTEQENLVARDNLKAHELTYATLRKKEYNYILENEIVKPECQINDEIRAHLVKLNYQFNEKSTISLLEVKKAYAKLHPDSQHKEGSDEAFQNANDAYNALVAILTDPENPHTTLKRGIEDDTRTIHRIELLRALD